MARYSVIQYVPDPVTDERINVGVLVFDEAGVGARFVRTWDRVKSFGGADVSFLRHFARAVDAATGSQQPLPIEPQGITQAVLETAAGEWKNTIQITPPRASTLGREALLDDVSRRFLRERVPQKRVRDRRAAAALAANSLARALSQEGSRNPMRYVHRNYAVEGSYENHDLDVALANGRLGLGVIGMSFEGGNAAQLGQEVAATAWTLDDVRKANAKLPLAVVALPPRGRSKTYDRARVLFADLGADVVTEDEVDDWAADAARKSGVFHSRASSRSGATSRR